MFRSILEFFLGHQKKIEHLGKDVVESLTKQAQLLGEDKRKIEPILSVIHILAMMFNPPHQVDPTQIQAILKNPLLELTKSKLSTEQKKELLDRLLMLSTAQLDTLKDPISQLLLSLKSDLGVKKFCDWLLKLNTDQLSKLQYRIEELVRGSEEEWKSTFFTEISSHIRQAKNERKSILLHLRQIQYDFVGTVQKSLKSKGTFK